MYHKEVYHKCITRTCDTLVLVIHWLVLGMQRTVYRKGNEERDERACSQPNHFPDQMNYFPEINELFSRDK